MSARELPAAIEAEQAVIGAVLFAEHAWTAASELQSDDFLLPAHRAIWDAIASLARAQVPADALLVWDRIVAQGDAAKLEGGVAYLSSLPGMSWNVVHYVARVRDASLRRRLISALADATMRAYDLEVATDDALSGARVALDKLSDGGVASARFSDLSAAVLGTIEARGRHEASARGAQTGLEALDRATGGLQPGWLVIIAAETGGGKTALAMQTAINVVLGGGTALACNLEMTREELAERALVHVGEVNSQLVRLGSTQGLWPRIMEADAKLGPTNFYLDDAANTLAMVSSRARRWRSRHREAPGILVVDFVQLLRSAMVKGQTRAQEVGGFAQDLKALAKELRVPVILVSQLNRAGIKAAKPSKSDLKESGDLENAADLILLPHNSAGTSDGPVEIIVDKFRHGERFTVDARWIGRHFKFANMHDERRY